MTRTELACYCLLASAFVLGAMLMFQVSRYVENTAHAEMVTTARSVSVLSTRADTDREMLYVLDSRNELLLGYLLDPNRRRFEFMGKLDIRDIMQRGGATPGRTGRRSR